ncbi:MAG: hypothetical protein UV73_C0005G0027 [Candidatus Gottesmanbacteria bacterium GW2011_GWA2_43_14]|uniref:Uncharacterized protein n=1 Tax=Candidatus Gottesmanbacteria bacterium GW2011_GWA2_43_14 TaxID=1618443 RepID=A0A0G1DIT1_9BACT|nr:MAG: hypothetical protein UV73_C0005G0027 [Candidatus Gottesmanbacteria bacterium GW2011_GWA2_43_14]
MNKHKMLTASDIEYLENRFKETFPTKDEFSKFRDSLFNKLDIILKEVFAGREEQTVISA